MDAVVGLSSILLSDGLTALSLKHTEALAPVLNGGSSKAFISLFIDLG